MWLVCENHTLNDIQVNDIQVNTNQRNHQALQVDLFLLPSISLRHLVPQVEVISNEDWSCLCAPGWEPVYPPF